MADIRKDQERDELHRAIWAIADGLRGSVDGWDFKSYVLGMMFYRYISENLTNYINEGEIEAGNEGFDYTAFAFAIVPWLAFSRSIAASIATFSSSIVTLFAVAAVP